MAMASAALSPTIISSIASRPSRQSRTDVRFISWLNSFEGLKAHNGVAALGLPISTERSFREGSGGALSSTCNAVGEIFRITAIMNGLVLIGVAVGFVLLRIEASLEESE
ncbi:hypothetical protein NMG60_11019638 [Bertholletia excelsa]